MHVVGRLRGNSVDNIHIQTVKAIMYQLVKVHFSFVVSPQLKECEMHNHIVVITSLGPVVQNLRHR